MPLVTMKSILQHADTQKYGVGAFNLLNMEAAKAAIETAETLRSPLIMQLAEIQLDSSPMKYMFPMMIQAAKEASVPVAVHYDHGITFDSIMKALKYGCTSVMFDGAALPFEENIRVTKEIANIAHAMGADCEAELGVVGGAEVGFHDDMKEVDEVLTDPSQAAEFVERTGCDFLAVAIENAHGPYAPKIFRKLISLSARACILGLNQLPKRLGARKEAKKSPKPSLISPKRIRNYMGTTIKNLKLWQE